MFTPWTKLTRLDDAVNFSFLRSCIFSFDRRNRGGRGASTVKRMIDETRTGLGSISVGGVVNFDYARSSEEEENADGFSRRCGLDAGPTGPRAQPRARDSNALVCKAAADRVPFRACKAAADARAISPAEPSFDPPSAPPQHAAVARRNGAASGPAGWDARGGDGASRSWRSSQHRAPPLGRAARYVVLSDVRACRAVGRRRATAKAMECRKGARGCVAITPT